MDDLSNSPLPYTRMVPQIGETKKQREKRHEAYMRNLVTSKHEDMKRKMLDLIDSIHKNENEELEEELKYVGTELRDWNKRCMEPVNFEAFVYDKMQKLQQMKEKKQLFEEQMQECDSVQKTKKKIAELEDLCQHYGMPNFVKNKVKMNDRQLIDQFTNGTEYAFHVYKNHSSINRTFIKQNYKQKPQTKGESNI